MVGVLSANKGGPLRLALRSSAWGEDGDSSFAGQYDTQLNVPPDRVVEAYKAVIASTYSIEAWRYRLDRGYQENEVAMMRAGIFRSDSFGTASALPIFLRRRHPHFAKTT